MLRVVSIGARGLVCCTARRVVQEVVERFAGFLVFLSEPPRGLASGKHLKQVREYALTSHSTGSMREYASCIHWRLPFLSCVQCTFLQVVHNYILIVQCTE